MTITTTKPADLGASATNNEASPSASRRSARRLWIAAAIAIVLAITAAGIAYLTNQSSEAAFVPFKTTNAPVADDASASVHGSGATLRTGAGASLVDSAGSVAASSSQDNAVVAHGSGPNVVTASGQPVH